MTDNHYNYKKKVRPEWYDNGPVKVFSQDEIDEWTRTRYDEVWAIIERTVALPESDRRYLDALKLSQAELQFNELMEGTRENNNDNGGGDGIT